MTLADKTQLGPWSRAGSYEANCQECDWGESWTSTRTTIYAARRHVDETGHVVDLGYFIERQVFLADNEPAR